MGDKRWEDNLGCAELIQYVFTGYSPVICAHPPSSPRSHAYSTHCSFTRLGQVHKAPFSLRSLSRLPDPGFHRALQIVHKMDISSIALSFLHPNRPQTLTGRTGSNTISPICSYALASDSRGFCAQPTSSRWRFLRCYMGVHQSTDNGKLPNLITRWCSYSVFSDLDFPRADVR